MVVVTMVVFIRGGSFIDVSATPGINMERRSWGCLPLGSVFGREPKLESDAEIQKVSPERVVRFAFTPRLPEHRDLGGCRAAPQRPEQAFEQKRMAQLLPIVIAQQVGTVDAIPVGQVGQMRMVERTDDLLE